MNRARSRARSGHLGGITYLYRRLIKGFSTGRNGFLYTLAQNSLNQLSTGTTPVTAVTDPVGFVADTRLGLALGAELVTNGTNPTNTTGWTPNAGATIAAVGGEFVVTSNTGGGTEAVLWTYTGYTVGKTYKVTLTLRAAAGVTAIVGSGSVFVTTTSTTNVPLTFVFVPSASSGNLYIRSQSLTPSVCYANNISIRLLEGNHALQATAGARPTWTNRVNLLTYSGLMSNAAWFKRGTAAIVDGQIDPYGGLTGEQVTVGVIATNDVYLPISGLAASVPLSAGVWIKRISTSGALKVINAASGAVGQWSVNMALLPDEYIYLTSTHASVTVISAFASTAGGSAGIQFGNNVAGNLQFLYGGTQLNLGSELSRYQRVTTATDFDTAGFPYYLALLGTDDSLTSATGGGGSAGFFWCGVVQPTGGAGTFRAIFDDRGTNTGYMVYLSDTNKLALNAGNGAAYTAKGSTATVDVGTKYLLTVYDDGVNLSVQINAAAAETVARPVVVAGSSGFTIGKSNLAAIGYLIGNLYPSVYWKDTAGTAAERADAQAYCRAMAGM